MATYKQTRSKKKYFLHNFALLFREFHTLKIFII